MHWEYKVVKTDSKVSFRKTAGSEEDMFNKLGAEGWELVNVDTNSDKSLTRAYFKRPASSMMTPNDDNAIVKTLDQLGMMYPRKAA